MPEIIDVPLSEGVARIELHGELESTNSLLRERFGRDHEDFTPFYGIATTSQTAGRGRLDREWVAPAGSSLAVSIYVEFDADAARNSIGWVMLAAGVALRDALVELAPETAERVTVKWPNDVLVDGKKVAGILGEFLGTIGGGEKFAVVIGTGINVGEPLGGLPFPQATSLDAAKVDIDQDALLATFVRHVANRILALGANLGNADESGLRGDLLLVCSTLGGSVRVTLPDDADLLGTATSIGEFGDLIVVDDGGKTHRVNVGDIEHVRPAEAGEAE